MKLFGKELNPIVIKVTFILLFLATLFAPFTFCDSYGHYRTSWDFLFDPPKMMTIDIPILFVEYVLILFFVCIVHLFMKDKDKSKSEY